MASSYPSLLSDNAILPLCASSDKRSAVESLIQGYVTGHVAMDVGIGMAGFLPVPGAGIGATVAAVAAQAPVIYQPMAREIAEIYSRSSDRITGNEVLRGAISGGLQDIAVDFGVEFLSEIARELLQELGAGFLLAGIPVIGGFVGIALDVKIAWAMTWRVGMMVAIYHENGGKWVKNRKHTYELVRRNIKLRKDDKGSPPTVAQIVAGIREVGEHQSASVTVMADMLISAGVSKEDVRAKLRERGVSADLIEKALSRVSAS